MARKQYDAAIVKEPQDPENYLDRGYFLAPESTDLAKLDFQKALELDPTNVRGQSGLGAVLASVGEYAEAETWLQKALKQNPDNAVVLSNLAEAQRNFGKIALAKTAIEKAIENEPDDWRNYYVQGLILQDFQVPADAAQSYTKAIARNPTFAALYNNRGNCYRGLDDFARARDDYRKVTELAPKNSDAFTSLGFAESRLGDYDQAITHLRLATQMNPGDGDAWDSLGFCFDSQEKYDDAYAAFTKLIELRPDSATAYAARAQASYYGDESEKALSDALDALKLVPDLSGAHFYAGYSAHELKKWKVALEHLTYLIDAGDEDNDDEIWRMRAECYDQLKQPELAAADRAKADTINAPLHEDDLELLDHIFFGETDKFVASLSPQLLPHIDRAAIPIRLGQITQHVDDIGNLMRKSVQTHQTYGRMETRVQMHDPWDEDAGDITMLILRDKKFQLLGIEVRGKDWSTMTLDALAGTDQIEKDVQALLDATFRGDVQAAIKAGPKDSMPVDQYTKFVKYASGVLGGLKEVVVQDTIITSPSRTGGVPMISVFSLAEKGSEERFLTCENQFVIGPMLEQAGFKFGDSVKAHYVSQNPRPTIRFAKTCRSGELDRFADLFFNESQAEVREDKLQGVILEALKASSGAFVQVVPESLISQVVIGDQLMPRTVSFTAKFENYDLPMRFEEEYGHPNSYVLLTDQSTFSWMNSSQLRDHWQPIATQHLNRFAKGEPEEVLKMLQSHSSFESLTKENVVAAQQNGRKGVGEIQSIEPSGATFGDSKWTYRFEITGSEGKAVGNVIFGQSNAQRRLINIGINPVQK